MQKQSILLQKKQNKEDIYFALNEIVECNAKSIVTDFVTDIKCNDNPNLNGVYYLSLYFNKYGDTYFKMRWDSVQNKYFEKLFKDAEEYYAVNKGLFEAIVDTRYFKQFAQKATDNIQDFFKDVIDPLYRGTLRISDELDLDRSEAVERDRRRAIKNLMRLKARIVSSATLNLSRPEFKNTYVFSI